MSQIETEPGTLVLVVDDDAVFRTLALRTLTALGFAVELFEGSEACVERLYQVQPDVILLDLQLGGMSGSQALPVMQAIHPDVPVVVVSASSSPKAIAALTRLGAYDYVTKPVAPKRLGMTVRNAAERRRLARRVARLGDGEADATGLLVGQAPVMRELRADILRVAATEVSVLIHGESGSGKELVARALHASSDRREGPFMAINCAAIPKTLEESELFGHERGAFTGATARHIGKLEHAHGGTLFLDEVAELSLSSQSKLLRALQERSLQRIGGNRDVPIDFRLLTASHASLQAEVAQGRFREDLFYRVVVFELEVPSLRARPGDVRVLVDHFLHELGPEVGGTEPSVSPEALSVLEHYTWPGNVRELRNALQHAVVNCNGEIILPSDLPARVAERIPSASASPPGSGVHAATSVYPPESRGDRIEPGWTLDQVEKRAIELAVERFRGNMSEAARELGIARSTLYRKLRQHAISSPE